ncbi:MAG TPA: hypothetical protein VND68_04985 [Chloroflexia bacterium]|nr:hypothetical protein [Chloroflexia bacterium]
MNRSHYLDQGKWHGSLYGLAIEYLPKGDDESLQRALETLWSAPGVAGPWRHKEDFGQPPAQPKISDQWLYGVLELPDNNTVGCMSFFFNGEQDIGDWLVLAVPTAMFSQIVPYFSRGDEYHPWLRNVDTRLVNIAEVVHSHAPFDLAEIAEELFGETSQVELTGEIIKRRSEHADYLLSPDLFERLKLNYKPVTLPSGMLWLVREDPPK